MDPTTIAEVEVSHAVSKDKTTFQELWKDQTCVIIFLRRFGWPFCRLSAREISSVLPQLKQHNVRLIGIGLESVGLQEFLEGQFFEGELFLDYEKSSYTKLGFKRDSLVKLLPSAFSKKWRDAMAKAKGLNLGGNATRGDGYQKGGCLVVGAGGTPTMFTYVQQDAADHASNEDILEALGIQAASSI